MLESLFAARARTERRAKLFKAMCASYIQSGTKDVFRAAVTSREGAFLHQKHASSMNKLKKLKDSDLASAVLYSQQPEHDVRDIHLAGAVKCRRVEE
jgi:hypothetical protein